MTTEKQKQWHARHNNFTVRREFFNELEEVRNEYVKRFNRNEKLGYIAEAIVHKEHPFYDIYVELNKEV
jgi:hypothetical protein